MSNYEKLCEAVEIESIDLGCCCNKDDCICIRGYIVDSSCPENCTNCEYFERHSMLLPLFTAEKQIELIKLIAKCNVFKLKYIDNQYMCWGNYDEYAYQLDIDFTEALAGLTLNLIEAGELEKDEVRRILE